MNTSAPGAPSPVNGEMLPNQGHSFGIPFSSSALWLMVRQFHAAGSLHSDCQGHGAHGREELRIQDERCAREMGRRLAILGMCWGLTLSF